MVSKRFLEFASAIPRLCESQDAERWGEYNRIVVDYEASKQTPFARNTNDAKDGNNRARCLFAFAAYGFGDDVKTAQCRRLVRLAELSHYKEAHGGIGEFEKLEYNTLGADATEYEATELESGEESSTLISSYYTVAEATSGSGWMG